jgi:hypothetical protein
MGDTATNGLNRSLDEQRDDFKKRRLTATPIAGLIIWAIIGVAGATLSPQLAVWVLFIGTGSTVYLGMFISKFTGENFLDKSRPKNTFDTLFFMSVLMAVLVYAIAIPFFLVDYTSLPLTVGILAGLMWVPISWIIGHWIGLFHAISRTILVLGAWYLFPDQRFVAIPAVIVVIYVISIFVLERRYQAVNEAS